MADPVSILTFVGLAVRAFRALGEALRLFRDGDAAEAARRSREALLAAEASLAAYVAEYPADEQARHALEQVRGLLAVLNSHGGLTDLILEEIAGWRELLVELIAGREAREFRLQADAAADKIADAHAAGRRGGILPGSVLVLLMALGALAATLAGCARFQGEETTRTVVRNGRELTILLYRFPDAVRDPEAVFIVEEDGRVFTGAVVNDAATSDTERAR